MYCAYIYTHIHIYIYIHVISELHSFEGQSILPMHLQQDIFWVKYNMHRRDFAWRHLEAGQYVAQSGLHLHQSETHSCKRNEKRGVMNFEMQVDLQSH